MFFGVVDSNQKIKYRNGIKTGSPVSSTDSVQDKIKKIQIIYLFAYVPSAFYRCGYLKWTYWLSFISLILIHELKWGRRRRKNVTIRDEKKLLEKNCLKLDGIGIGWKTGFSSAKIVTQKNNSILIKIHFSRWALIQSSFE